MTKTEKCPYCDKRYSKKGIGTHIWRNHTIDGKKFNPNCRYKTGQIIWNKGLTKETDIRVKNYSDTLREKFKNGELKTTPCKHTEEFKNKQRERAIQQGLGGITQSRWINYKGKRLGSSYELKVAESLDEHNIKWDTCKKFKYIDPFGKKRTYTPDIYLVDYDIYLDPKNDFLINNINPRIGFKDVDKIKLVEIQNSIKIFILNKEQLLWNIIKQIIMPM